MGLIKSTQAPLSLTAFSMGDIEKAARAIIVRAERQAEQLLVEAQKEAQALQVAARKEGAELGQRMGHAAGLEAGAKAGHAQALAEHREQLAKALQALTAVLAELNARRCELEVAAVREVIDLAIAIAQRATKRLGVMDGAVVEANVAEALKLVVHAADLRIVVHPTQKATLTDALPRLKMAWPSLEHVELVDDAALAPGGCRILTRHGSIDADLDVQLQNIVADLVPAS
jgi:flagellar assembly protein FliH